MGRSAALRYHGEAFRLLGKTPIRLSLPAERMRAIEKKHGIRFPPSVREWFVHGGKGVLGKLIARHRDKVKEFAWERLGGPVLVKEISRRVRYDPRTENVLLLASGEPDGFWAVRLDGDDPPVVWADSVPSSPSLGGWQQVAGSFSEFVLGCVWQYDLAGRAYRDGGSLIGTCLPPLRPRDLAFLLANSGSIRCRCSPGASCWRAAGNRRCRRRSSIT
jgi:hypothetical protein